MFLQAGDLKKRVFLQTSSSTTGVDSFGDPVTNRTWSNDATLWANVYPVSGQERLSAKQINPEVSHVVRGRYYEGVRTDKRFLVPMDYTLLNGGINSTGLTVAVDSAAAFPPAKDYRALIESEIIEVTSGAGSTSWTVTRGIDGTSASCHEDDTQVFFLSVLDIDSVLNVNNRNTELKVFCKESL